VGVAPGTLLVAPPTEASNSTFAQTVILIVDREPNGISTGLAINRPTDQRVIDSSALALLFIPEPDARVFWGGPMGSDPAILAQFTSIDGLEWFHLPIRQQRPFPLPDVGVIAVAEHPAPFEDRIRRARLFSGLCVWGRGQLEAELSRDAWQTLAAAPDHIFSAQPERLWLDFTRA
jgi:putative AlgH/UPF0301 family transcriptional regulator